MSALLAAAGWKVLAGLGALLAVALAWFASLYRAKATGVAQQQAADTKKKEADLEQATIASGTVSGLDDADVIDELHRGYDRKPLRMGEGNQRRP